MKKGRLFVITGPSGVGKGTILKKFLEQNKETVYYSVSMTTRPPRPGEIEGVNYHFVSYKDFIQSVENDEFLEWAEYSGNLYGTSKVFVNRRLNQGKDVILEIETQGAKNIMDKYSDCVSIFISAPDFKELEARLRGRHTENEGAIQKRLKIVQHELKMAELYQYNIVNDTVENALQKLQEIYDFERNKES